MYDSPHDKLPHIGTQLLKFNKKYVLLTDNVFVSEYVM